MLKMKLWIHFTRILRKCHQEKDLDDPSDEDVDSSFSSEDLDAPRISIDSDDHFDESDSSSAPSAGIVKFCSWTWKSRSRQLLRV